MAEYLEYESSYKVGNHHYAKQFALHGYNILWLSPVYNNLYYFKDKDIYMQRRDLHKSSLTELEHNIFGYAPYSFLLYGKIPVLDTRLAARLSIKWTSPSLVSVLKKNGFDEVDILWLTNPKYYSLIDKIKYKKLFYRCADDISGFKDSCETTTYFESEIIKKADKVFVTSHSLMEKRKNLRDDYVNLPNGVELDNFVKDKYDLPIEYRNKERKKCIYVGAIDNWFDVNLVKFCAEKLKDIDFYLIGPVKIDLSLLKDSKNIHILGRKDYKEIGNYMFYSNVSMIPFKINRLTDSISPIKLFEYMSTGLNVVSTNFKEIKKLNSPALIGRSYEEFCDYLMLGIIRQEENKERNIKFAKENTWNKRFEQITYYL